MAEENQKIREVQRKELPPETPAIQELQESQDNQRYSEVVQQALKILTERKKSA